MKCSKCGGTETTKSEDRYCETCKNPLCERLGCNKPATRSIYGFGYIAVVCQEHYDAASEKDKEDAITFRYAE